MTKRNNCKICGKYSAKRKVCKECKEEQPYVAAAASNLGGGNPFERNGKITKNS